MPLSPAAKSILRIIGGATAGFLALASTTVVCITGSDSSAGDYFQVARAAMTPAPTKLNGFELKDALIPRKEIVRGGPPRDGIPSIDNPKFIPPSEADYLRTNDTVLSVTFNGETRAYPLRILVWHEIVNDTIGSNHLAVTYCPLCGTGMVFDRQYGTNVLEFGVSGLLHKSDVLMYDRQSESLWSQLGMKAVSGEYKGRKMKWLPSEHMTFAAWKRKYPNGIVLSTDTGFRRRYGRMPYHGYEHREKPTFRVGPIRDDLRNKEWVVGVFVGDQPYAVPLKRIPLHNTVKVGEGDKLVRVRYDSRTQLVNVFDTEGDDAPYVKAYWFAWQAFYPDTRIFPE